MPKTSRLKRPEITPSHKQAASILSKNVRVLIAIDGTGVHVRETLNVTHDLTRGEVTYQAVPVASFRSPRVARKAILDALLKIRAKPSARGIVPSEFDIH